MLEIKALNLKINKKEILKDINLSLEANKITALIGKNGSGKSSLISCVNQMNRYDGEILLNKKNIREIENKERAKQIAILPQNLLSVHIKVYDLVSYGRNPYLDLVKKIDINEEEIIEKSLNLLGINDLKEKYVDEISGGERQKAYIAMMLSQDTDIMLLDEPTTYVDMEYEFTILETLKKLDNKTILIVMHDLNQAIKYANNIVLLENGKIIFNGSKDECLNKEIIEKHFGLKKYIINGKVFFSQN